LGPFWLHLLVDLFPRCLLSGLAPLSPLFLLSLYLFVSGQGSAFVSCCQLSFSLYLYLFAHMGFMVFTRPSIDFTSAALVLALNGNSGSFSRPFVSPLMVFVMMQVRRS
jgi:hypothetical protein